MDLKQMPRRFNKPYTEAQKGFSEYISNRVYLIYQVSYLMDNKSLPSISKKTEGIFKQFCVLFS